MITIAEQSGKFLDMQLEQLHQAASEVGMSMDGPLFATLSEQYGREMKRLLNLENALNASFGCEVRIEAEIEPFGLICTLRYKQHYSPWMRVAEVCEAGETILMERKPDRGGTGKAVIYYYLKQYETIRSVMQLDQYTALKISKKGVEMTYKDKIYHFEHSADEYYLKFLPLVDIILRDHGKNAICPELPKVKG